MPTAKDIFHLEKINDVCKDYNQDESQNDRRLVELGHPDVEAYKTLREFFNSLRYACNSSARYYSYVNQYERTQYWAPSLSLSWYPNGPLQRFGHIFPAHDHWTSYIEAAGATAFEGAGPHLDAGKWIIVTRNQKLIASLKDLSGTPADPFSLSAAPSINKGNIFTIATASCNRHLRLVDVISRFHEILPPRSPLPQQPPAIG